MRTNIKQRAVAEKVRRDIANGILKRGTKLAPDVELAKEWKLSKTTVAAGLNLLVKEGYLSRSPKRGTIVVFDRVIEPKSGGVGLVLHSRGDVHENMAFRISQNLFLEHLYPILISDAVVLDQASVMQFLNAVNQQTHRPYGYLIAGSMNFPFSEFIPIAGEFENIVFLDVSEYPEKIDHAKYVLCDYEDGGRQVAEFFGEQKCRTVAHFAVPEPKFSGEWGSIQAKMHNGFLKYCFLNQMNSHNEIFWKTLHGMDWGEALDELLASPEPPSGILCYSDFSCVTCLLPELKKRNLIGKIQTCSLYNTPKAEKYQLNSIDVNSTEVAKVAVASLTHIDYPREIKIKPKLIRRNFFS